MLIDLILQDKRYRTSRWDVQIKASGKENYFILILTALFEYVYLSLLEKLQNTCPTILPIVKPTLIHATVLKDLIAGLRPMLLRTTILELHTAKELGILVGDTPEERFAYFIDLLWQPEHTLALLQKYPVLKQLLNVFITQYIAATFELLQRLQQDFSEIKSCFLADANASDIEIVSLERGAGDTHKQHRCVTILTILVNQKNTKLVYKPRSLAVDHAFNNLLGWFNARSELQLMFPKLIVKKDYGWCEFIEYKSCHEQLQIERFYQREGALLAIIYLLAGSDIHAENIIAHGEYPIIVDLECLLRPVLDTQDGNDNTASRFFVSNTHFLPARHKIKADYAGVDISALGARGGEPSLYEGLICLDTGSDSMRLIRKRFALPAACNQPQLDQTTMDPLDYCQDFIKGFVSFYQLILANIALLKNEHSPLKLFREVEIRVIMRATDEYAKLLFESYHPTLLFNELQYQQHWQWLQQQCQVYPILNQALQAEIVDLGEGNIPIFTCNAQGKLIVDSYGKPVNINIIQSGFTYLESHLERIGQIDLRLQIAIIEHSFAALQLNNKQDQAVYKWKFMPAKFYTAQDKRNKCNAMLIAEDCSSLIKAKALQFAKQQLAMVAKLRIVNKERIFWPHTEIITKQVWQAGFTNIHLYNGLAGIMLTFAYAAKIFKEQAYQEIAETCLKSLRLTLEKYRSKCMQSIGVYAGLGGFLYAFTCLYQLWQDPSLKQDIQNLLELLPPLLTVEKELDIVSGTAGCLAGLLACRNVMSEKTIKSYASACAEKILKYYPEPNIFADYSNNELLYQPQTGFAHGVAGIAWALTKYHALFPSYEVRDWIASALSYERACFSHAASNWPDFRKSSDTQHPAFVTQWCYGAMGIGLARFDMANCGWQDSIIQSEINVALKTTLKNGFGGYHNLCHGDFGNLELLLQLSADKTKQHYLTYVAPLLNEIEQGRLRCNELENVISPGLMTGNTGVAYQLMRIACPEIVPNILLLQVAK